MLTMTRTIFAWLLLLLIPMQGFAATAMLACVPSHHQAMVDEPNPQMVHHHTDHAPSNHAAQNEASSPDTLQKLGEAGAAKCNMFASCCIASIIASPLPMLPVASTGSAPVAFVQLAFLSYKPEQLDPPPKPPLA